MLNMLTYIACKVRVMASNVTFNNIPVISWRSGFFFCWKEVACNIYRYLENMQFIKTNVRLHQTQEIMLASLLMPIGLIAPKDLYSTVLSNDYERT